MHNLQISVQSAEIRTQTKAESTLQACKVAGATHLSVNLLAGGAHYNSSYFPHCPTIEPGFDPWGWTIQRAHELNIKVQEWFCPGAIQVWPEFDMAGKCGLLPTQHWWDFDNPAGRQRLLDMETDMLDKYPDCDGVGLDYIRSLPPTPTWNPAACTNIDNITETVEMIANMVHRKRKEVSAHVFYAGWMEKLQDWPNWVRVGYLDWASVIMQAWPDWGGYKTWPAGHLVRYWCDTYLIPEGLGDKIWPYIYVPNYKTNPMTLKTPIELAVQLGDARAAGFNNLCLYDSKHLMTPEYAAVVKNAITDPIVVHPLLAPLTALANGFDTQVSALGSIIDSIK
jgi:hypothetical protein